jgi:lipopolysaccharide biosynthesis glycosyltransferase
MSPDQIPVLVVAADWRYAMPMCVLLSSVERHLTVSPAVDVYILDCGIGWSNRRRVRQLFSGGKLRLHWRRVNERQLCRYPTSGHIKAAAYARLLIPDLLPESVTRAVYLDCDIVVLADIGELWAKDMHGAPLMACQEADCVLSSPGGVVRYRELGFAGDEPYLNSGVLLMDLVLWRRNEIHKRVFSYLCEYSEDVVFHDQDGINAVLGGKWSLLERGWNVRIDLSSRADDGGNAGINESCLTDAGIIHWASRQKPWHQDVEHWSVGLFYKMALAASVPTECDWQPFSLKVRRFLGRMCRAWRMGRRAM